MIRNHGLLKVALLQFGAGADKAANLAKAERMALEALNAGAKFVLLPEVFNFRGDTRDKAVLALAAERFCGPSSERFIPLARKYNAAFLLGSIIEKTVSSKVYNTALFIDAHGDITAKYRKIHLFDARIGDKIIRESDCFLPGQHLARAAVGDFSVGISICYDLRFPGLYQRYARQGADILTVPSCFTKKTGEAHWEPLLRARAIENLSYVLAPNQVGIDARGMEAYGNSMIISPWGEIVARGNGRSEEIVYGDIDGKQLDRARQILPGIIK